MRSKWTTGVGLVLSVVILTACPSDDQPPAQPESPAQEPAAQEPATEPSAVTPGDLPEGVTEEMFAQGHELFNGEGICFTCHGTDGVGGPLAPDLTSSEWLWVDPNDPDALAEIETLIKTGVAQPKEYAAPMPPMGGASLTDDQVAALAGYVLAIGQNP